MVVGPAILRPVLVGVVRAGYEVKDYASQAWQQAKVEAESIRTEARTASEAAELQQLRDEVAALRTQVNRRSATAGA
jgi:ubiquinone biosynthesis protein UbiJ